MAGAADIVTTVPSEIGISGGMETSGGQEEAEEDLDEEVTRIMLSLFTIFPSLFCLTDF